MRFALANKTNTRLDRFDEFQNNFSKLFNDFFEVEPSQLFENEWKPAVDVNEDDKAITIKAEMPGIDEKDLSVTLENEILTIKGEKRSEHNEENEERKYIVSERHYGSFSRSIRLPKSVIHDKVKADFKSGVLTVVVPKSKEQQPKRIKIDVAK